jgi:hypothetical protein
VALVNQYIDVGQDMLEVAYQRFFRQFYLHFFIGSDQFFVVPVIYRQEDGKTAGQLNGKWQQIAKKGAKHELFIRHLKT